MYSVHVGSGWRPCKRKEKTCLTVSARLRETRLAVLLDTPLPHVVQDLVVGVDDDVSGLGHRGERVTLG